MAIRKKKTDPKQAVKIGVVGAGLAVGGFALFKYLNQGTTAAPAASTAASTALPVTTASTTKVSTSTKTSSASWIEGTFPLYPSTTRNKKVLALQKALIALGGSPADLLIKSGGADGIFGSGTAAALKAASANPAMVEEKTFNGFLQKATTGLVANAVSAGVPVDIAQNVLTVRTEIMAFNTDELAIIGIFAAKSDEWLKAFQAAYNARYGKNKLADDLRRDVGNDFATLVNKLDSLNVQYGISGNATEGIPSTSAKLSLTF